MPLNMHSDCLRGVTYLPYQLTGHLPKGTVKTEELLHILLTLAQTLFVTTVRFHSLYSHTRHKGRGKTPRKELTQPFTLENSSAWKGLLYLQFNSAAQENLCGCLLLIQSLSSQPMHPARVPSPYHKPLLRSGTLTIQELADSPK